MDPTDAVWSALDGQCLTVDACTDDADSVIRIIDAIEDRLFTVLPSSTEPADSMRMGDWMREELAAIGLAAYLTPEQISRQARGDEELAKGLKQRVEAAQLLTEGRIDQAVKLLATLAEEFRLGWSARYILGRLLAAQDRLTEAVDQLERAYRSLGRDDAMSETGADRLDATRQACLISLVRLYLRHGRLDTAQRFLADLRRLPVSSTGTGATAVEIEQVRLDGRRGSEGVPDTANGVVNLLWRSPVVALRLLESVDLAPIRSLVTELVVDTIEDEIGRAARAVERALPEIRRDSVRLAMTSARAFAQQAAAELRGQFLLVDALVDHRGDSACWIVDRDLAAAARRAEQLTTEEASRQQTIDVVADTAASRDIPAEVFDPVDRSTSDASNLSDDGSKFTADPSILAGSVPIEVLDTEGDADSSAAEVPEETGAVVPAKMSARERREAIRDQLQAATTARDKALAELNGLTKHPVAMPVQPGDAHLGTALASGLVFFLSFLLVSRFGYGWLSLSAAMVAVAVACLAPWLIRLYRFKSYEQEFGQAKAAVPTREAEHAELTRVVEAFDKLDRTDQTIASARAAAQDATNQLEKALEDRDKVAATLQPAGLTPADFARALSVRMQAFDRAFAQRPHFWWPQLADERPAMDGALMRIGEQHRAQLGLLEGWRGDRLIRVALDRRTLLDVSDVWAVFGRRERHLAMRLEAYLTRCLMGG